MSVPAPHLAATVPVVTLTDRFDRYVARVELHEIDGLGQARVLERRGAGGGKWRTVPVLFLKFDAGHDRAALIRAAFDRHAATQARRDALNDSPSPQRGKGRDQGAPRHG